MDVLKFFEDRLRRYGVTREALDLSEEGQSRRFEVLGDVADMSGKTVLDLGSGFGDLYDYLSSRYTDISYTGYDFSESFVKEARNRHPKAEFQVLDVFKDDFRRTFDFVVSSGVHNLETGTNDADMEFLLAKAWDAASEAVAINMLSIHADWVDTGCHQYDPIRMLAGALELTRHSVLRHDYMPHDFTLYLYRKPRAR